LIHYIVAFISAYFKLVCGKVVEYQDFNAAQTTPGPAVEDPSDAWEKKQHRKTSQPDPRDLLLLQRSQSAIRKIMGADTNKDKKFLTLPGRR